VLITRIDPADDETLRGCHRVAAAVQPVDDPRGFLESYGPFVVGLTTAWGDHPAEAWAARDEPGGEVTGYCQIGLPDRENLDTAFAFPTVHPERRGQGVGRELLRHAAARAAAEGRTVLRGTGLAGTAGDAFAARVGAKVGLVSVRRAVHLRGLPDGLVARQRAAATSAAAGYSLVTWVGATPPEHWAGVAGVLNAFADAPAPEGFEREAWDASLVRDRFDRTTTWADIARRYTVGAVHAQTGELTALTELFVVPEAPAWAIQGLTAVTRAHRGHRLGLLVKCAMLDWLAAAEPGVEHILTDNADSNQYMIAVNELLGFEVLAPASQWYELSVAEVR